VWSLDTLAEAANTQGITVARYGGSCSLRVFRWRQVRSWAVSKDPEFTPKDSNHRPVHPFPDDTTVVCVDEFGPQIPRTYPAQPGWTADGNRVIGVIPKNLPADS
jgi:hypothetical protein